ncbi:MAG: hypothetical protein ACC742_14705, partial [Thermoanaerobaculales bacterium]
MNTNNRLMVTALALALAFAASGQAAGPGIDEQALAEAADRARLQEIAAVLADPDARERFSAVHALVNMASDFVVLPPDISDLLNRAAIDSDPEIARFASNALYQFKLRARRLAEQPPETRPEAELQELAKQRELEDIAAVLNDPRSRERFSAAHALANLASSYKVLPVDVLNLLQRTRADDDLEIARLAETVLAKREGRPVDPSFVPEAVASMEEPAAPKRQHDPFAMLSHPNPSMRYDALVNLLEIAPKDGRSVDPEIMKAFTEATADPDPRVSSYAEFAIGGGLAGDENALRQVYIGKVQPMAIGGFDQQPPSPEQAEARQNQGYLDEHGAFIGVTKASPGEGQQPPSLEQAGALEK